MKGRKRRSMWWWARIVQTKPYYRKNAEWLGELYQSELYLGPECAVDQYRYGIE